MLPPGGRGGGGGRELSHRLVLRRRWPSKNGRGRGGLEVAGMEAGSAAG